MGLWILHSALFEGTAELVKVNSAGVHHVKILEHLHETGLLRHLGVRFLNQLVLESFLESGQTNKIGKSQQKSSIGAYLFC